MMKLRLLTTILVFVLLTVTRLHGQDQRPPAPELSQPLEADANAIFEKARAAKENVEAWNEQLKEGIEQISALSQQFEGAEFQLAPEKQSIDVYRQKILPAMLKGAEEILAQRKDFEHNFELYSRSIDFAVPALREASEVWHRYATEETEREFQEQYTEGARTIERWAEIFQTRQTRLNTTRHEIDDKVAYVERSALLLNRLDALLSLYPNEADASAQIEAYLVKLQTFQQQFRVLLKSFHDLGETFQERETGPQDSKTQPLSNRFGTIEVRKAITTLNSVGTISGKTVVTGQLPLREDQKQIVNAGQRLSVQRNGTSLGTITVTDATRTGFAAVAAGFEPQVGDVVVLPQ